MGNLKQIAYICLSIVAVAQSCPTLCNSMNCNTLSFPVPHSLPEFAQTHVHWVSDAIQPSHPLSLPAALAFNLSQYQGLFQWVDSSYQAAKVLECQLKQQSFQRIIRVDFLCYWLVWSPCCPRDSQESSLTPQFKSINYSALRLLCGPTLSLTHDCWENYNSDYMDLFQQSDVCFLMHLV